MFEDLFGGITIFGIPVFYVIVILIILIAALCYLLFFSKKSPVKEAAKNSPPTQPEQYFQNQSSSEPFSASQPLQNTIPAGPLSPPVFSESISPKKASSTQESLAAGATAGTPADKPQEKEFAPAEIKLKEFGGGKPLEISPSENSLKQMLVDKFQPKIEAQLGDKVIIHDFNGQDENFLAHASVAGVEVVLVLDSSGKIIDYKKVNSNGNGVSNNNEKEEGGSLNESKNNQIEEPAAQGRTRSSAQGSNSNSSASSSVNPQEHPPSGANSQGDEQTS